MKVYSVKEVARLLDLSPAQVRAYARASLLEPERGDQGEWRFSFQDLVVLRTAKGLVSARIPARKIREAVERLRSELPDGRPLSGVQLRADGDRILARRGGEVWDASDGQSEFDFGGESAQVRPHVRREPAPREEDDDAFEDDLEAEDWYGIGVDLESAAPEHARDAYRRALELDPDHVDARINAGRLLHEAGLLGAAESNLRMILDRHPEHPVALFNLAVLQEDRQQFERSIETYRRVVVADPESADAWFNLGRLLEKYGDAQEALRCLQTYRRLRRDP